MYGRKTSEYKMREKELNFEISEFPVKLESVPKFQNQKPNISINELA